MHFNTSVFCTNLRHELGGKTKNSRLVSGFVKTLALETPEADFNRTKVLMVVGTNQSLGILIGLITEDQQNCASL